MNKPATVIHLVDDDESIRKALTRLLKAEGFVVQSYASGSEFLAALPLSGFGCVILDVCMPGLSGIDIQRSLANDACQLPVVFLTGHGDIPMSVQAIKAGAVDFLTKPVQRATLLVAVQNALQLDAEQRASKVRTAEVFDDYRSLTPREQSILRLVVAGKLNKQIATSLDISERTVKAHRAQVMSKMNVTSVADLVRTVSMLGLNLTDE